MTDGGQGSSGSSGRSLDGAIGAVLGRVGQGDEEAFGRLYDLSASRVHGLVHQVVGDAERSEQVSAEVFVEVWRTASRFRRGGGALNWLLAVAHRKAVAHVRTTRGSLPGSTTVTAGAGRPCDPALALSYYEGYAVTDVAVALGISVDVVHQRLRAGLLALQPGRAVA
ncbi:sigma factor [Terrabacter carboxydivorans]|uniref:ECF RNA polymerase sigma factor SigK n=1 Tax=Terrabacter carboxydivorans TaxID=619730 RepID=A0ABP5YIG3_9MICO